MHTQLKKPPVRQRQVHEPKRTNNIQQKHVDQRPEAQRMTQLKQLAATRARPEDQRHDQLQALADKRWHQQHGSIQAKENEAPPQKPQETPTPKAIQPKASGDMLSQLSEPIAAKVSHAFPASAPRVSLQKGFGGMGLSQGDIGDGQLLGASQGNHIALRPDLHREVTQAKPSPTAEKTLYHEIAHTTDVTPTPQGSGAPQVVYSAANEARADNMAARAYAGARVETNETRGTSKGSGIQGAPPVKDPLFAAASGKGVGSTTKKEGGAGKRRADTLREMISGGRLEDTRNFLENEPLNPDIVKELKSHYSNIILDLKGKAGTQMELFLNLLHYGAQRYENQGGKLIGIGHLGKISRIQAETRVLQLSATELKRFTDLMDLDTSHHFRSSLYKALSISTNSIDDIAKFADEMKGLTPEQSMEKASLTATDIKPVAGLNQGLGQSWWMSCVATSFQAAKAILNPINAKNAIDGEGVRDLAGKQIKDRQAANPMFAAKQQSLLEGAGGKAENSWHATGWGAGVMRLFNKNIAQLGVESLSKYVWRDLTTAGGFKTRKSWIDQSLADGIPIPYACDSHCVLIVGFTNSQRSIITDSLGNSEYTVTAGTEERYLINDPAKGRVYDADLNQMQNNQPFSHDSRAYIHIFQPVFK